MTMGTSSRGMVRTRSVLASCGSSAAIDEFIARRLTHSEMADLGVLLRKLLRDILGGRAIDERYGPDAAALS